MFQVVLIGCILGCIRFANAIKKQAIPAGGLPRKQTTCDFVLLSPCNRYGFGCHHSPGGLPFNFLYHIIPYSLYNINPLNPLKGYK
jgi:hypothetical protein